MDIGFDLISDLNLSPDENFDWENKATSLYCIVAGNVSSDLATIEKTLRHLTRFYQGVFYIMGTLEYGNEKDIDSRTLEILEMCSTIPNLATLLHHVVIIDGIALVGCNGWAVTENLEPAIRKARLDDLGYLYQSVAKLQKHLDVKRILVVSSAVPTKELYYGEHPKFYEAYAPLDYCLDADTEMKIVKWAFGSYEKTVDAIFSNVHYINNPRLSKYPYWAKRITFRP